MLEITNQQQLFVHEYMIDLDATKAAIRAGYSPKVAGQQGHKLLQKPHVKAAIQRQMDKRSRKTDITAEYVLNSIKAVADDTKEDRDRLKALELLGKHLRLFTDRQEITGADGGPLQIVSAIPRPGGSE